MTAIRPALAALLLACTLSLSATVAAREIPIADFYKHGEFSAISLSPDGKHMAVSVPQQDRTILAILSVADGKMVSNFDYGEDRHFREVVWANNERLLFFVTKKTGRYDFEVGNGDLYAANLDGSRRMDIPNGNTYSIVDTLPGDRESVLVQRSVENAFLSRLNVYNGRVSTVAQAPVHAGHFVVDHDQKVRYVIGAMDDGREITMRRDGDKWTKVHESGRNSAEFRPLWFAADNKRVYVVKSDGDKPGSVVLLDPETRQETPVSSNPNVDPSGFLLSSDRKTLLGIWYEDGLPSWDFVAPEHPETKVYASLSSAFGDKAVTFFDTTEDGRYIGVRTYSDVAPSEAFLFDRQTGKAKFLAASREWIKPAELSQTRDIVVRARDGKNIHGLLTVPKGNGKNLPLILFVHGGPHGIRDTWGFDADAQLFANRGYAVMQVNYRGSGGYGNGFLRAGFRKWGTAMQDDLTDSVKWAIQQGIVDKDRICIYGASYGGYAALMSVTREPDLYKCTVGYVGVYSLPMMRQKGDIPGVESGRNYLKDVLPETNGELQAQSPAYNVEKIKVPIMLVHGAKDERVPIAQMHFLISQLKAAGKAPEEVVVADKEAHGFRKVENNVDLYTKMLAFFDRHIGAGAKKTAQAD